MIIIAETYIKPEKIDEVRKMYEKVIQHTRKQPGCLDYKLYQNIDNPDILMFVEEWETEEDFIAHLEDEIFLSIYYEIEKYFVKDEIVKKYKVFAEGEDNEKLRI